MIQAIGHDLTLSATRDERSRQEFVAALRSHVLGDMAEHMRKRYHARYASRAEESEASDGTQVHELMQSDPYFRFYSAIRLNAQLSHVPYQVEECCFVGCSSWIRNVVVFEHGDFDVLPGTGVAEVVLAKFACYKSKHIF